MFERGVRLGLRHDITLLLGSLTHLVLSLFLVISLYRFGLGLEISISF